jgi:citrate lyase subunit beta / citryl-CoA lyase
MTATCWLFAPGDSPAKAAKAAASGAEAIILDLEDSIAPDGKDKARRLTADFLRAHPPGSRGAQVWVRINSLDTPLALADLSVIVPAAPDGVVLPKPDSAADVIRLSHYLDALEAAAGLPAGAVAMLPITTETPAALFALGGYSAAGPRLAALTWGAEDLPAAVGALTNKAPAQDGYSDLCRLARTLCLAGAAAAAVPAIEAVYADFRDLAGLEGFAARARQEGFAGMLAIHPAQVLVIQAAFRPSAAEIERARRIVALFAANPGAGALALDGRMVDAPHLKQAQRLLRRAES